MACIHYVGIEQGSCQVRQFREGESSKVKPLICFSLYRDSIASSSERKTVGLIQRWRGSDSANAAAQM